MGPAGRVVGSPEAHRQRRGAWGQQGVRTTDAREVRVSPAEPHRPGSAARGRLFRVPAAGPPVLRGIFPRPALQHLGEAALPMIA